MSLLQDHIAEVVRQGIRAAQAAGQLPTFDIPELTIGHPKRPEHGDFASSVALQVQKLAGKPPLDVARIIQAHLPQADFLSAVEVAPPGFINFRVSSAWLAAQVDHILAAGERVFQSSLGAGKKAQVEYVSANPTGPLSVHRIRGGVIGDTIANLLAAVGYDVTREYYFNDAGQQMNILGESVRARYLELLDVPVQFPEKGYKGLYIRMIAAMIYAFKGDSMRDASVEDFRAIATQGIIRRILSSLARVNIRHDVYFNEVSLYESRAVWDTVEELRARGYVYEKDGATWFASSQLGDEKDRVIVKRTGDPTYRLPDIAYHRNKLERGFDLIVDVFGADHAATAPQVLLGVRALGHDPSVVRTIIHQMVELVEAGESRRMSTRRGDFVELDELLEDVGADAVRYFILAQNPNTAMNFDLDLARSQGDENPVYRIQNAHVRCAGILRKTAARGLDDDGADLSLLGPDELGLVRKMLEAEEVIERAVVEMAPQSLAHFALELAGLFHPVYDRVRVISDQEDIPLDVQKARLRFYRAAKVVFKRLLTLMGMSAPEAMERRERKDAPGGAATAETEMEAETDGDAE
ncbi:MAG: arginine--tRNA ligase [Anaerolineae bacterium]|nr:arginine--tRNA ligase [Anaerolineae bacterium]